jgi:hypothetical protein
MVWIVRCRLDSACRFGKDGVLGQFLSVDKSTLCLRQNFGITICKSTPAETVNLRNYKLEFNMAKAGH